MVEMSESALILHHATEHSLVLMDEIGRGTSTFDGLALAWACAEHLLTENRALCLFATHYFELTQLAERNPSADNIHLEALEHDGRIIFMHQVKTGAASKSYGIQVAELAGLPAAALRLARRQLARLETIRIEPDHRAPATDGVPPAVISTAMGHETGTEIDKATDRAPYKATDKATGNAVSRHIAARPARSGRRVGPGRSARSVRYRRCPARTRPAARPRQPDTTRCPRAALRAQGPDRGVLEHRRADATALTAPARKCYFYPMTTFSRVGLIVRVNDDSVANTLADVIDCLEGLQIEPVLEHGTAGLVSDRDTVSTAEIGQSCDLAVIIGGDGTLLHAARALADASLPMVGINRGRLGFLVDVPPDQGLDDLQAILQGQYIEEERIMLETRILREGECIGTSYAFNDTVIRVRDLLQIMDFDIIIDDVLGDPPAGRRSDHRHAVRLDCVRPCPTAGPIVGPTVNTVILQPICPHTLNSRALLVGSDSRIRVHLWDDEVLQAQVVCDGQVYMEATLGDMIDVRVKNATTRLLHPETYDFHRILREKLNWG